MVLPLELTLAAIRTLNGAPDIVDAPKSRVHRILDPGCLLFHKPQLFDDFIFLEIVQLLK